MMLVPLSQQVYAEPGNTTIEDVGIIPSTGALGFSIFDPDGIASIEVVPVPPFVQKCTTELGVRVTISLLPTTLTVIDCQDEPDVTVWELTEDGVTCIEGSCLTIATFDSIADQVESLDLPQGTQVSLLSKLDNAQKSVDKGNNDAAINQLEAFINQVNAQRDKKIDSADADALIAQAQALIDVI